MAELVRVIVNFQMEIAALRAESNSQFSDGNSSIKNTEEL